MVIRKEQQCGQILAMYHFIAKEDTNFEETLYLLLTLKETHCFRCSSKYGRKRTGNNKRNTSYQIRGRDIHFQKYRNAIEWKCSPQ